MGHEKRVFTRRKIRQLLKRRNKPCGLHGYLNSREEDHETHTEFALAWDGVSAEAACRRAEFDAIRGASRRLLRPARAQVWTRLAKVG